MSDARRITDQFFFANTGMDPDRVTAIIKNNLNKGGELFMQRSMGKVAYFSDGRLETSRNMLDQGFGVRYISGASDVYAHSQDFSEREIQNMAKWTRQVSKTSSADRTTLPSGIIIPRLYTADNPLEDISDEQRIKILENIDTVARNADPRVIQVSASITTGWNVITIIRHDGQRFDDVRPMSQIFVGVQVEDGNAKEEGTGMFSARMKLSELFRTHSYEDTAREAVRSALLNLTAVPAPMGEMPVVLGNGWAGVMLHESVGHGLEGDFARRGSSVYSGEVGKRVASRNVTIVDQGNIEGARGSIHFDDEGTPTQKTVLIEKGILRGYMQDVINARLMGTKTTGNGRREDYQKHPLPRMTNTYMEAGEHSPEEIIASVERGIYAVNFAGGQVDTVSGDYVFAPTEAYLIENGKVTVPVRKPIMVGNGPKSMRRVDMVGNDLQLSNTGSCGKDGQTVPVLVGQPTVKMRGIKIGGSEPA